MSKLIYLHSDWEVKGFYPYVPFLGKSLETGEEIQGVTDWMPATVPGSVQYDLWKSGWIPDPYYGLNSLLCEWTENRWWMYRNQFDCTKSETERVYLCCRGLDYKALIYVNNKLITRHEGMFQSLTLDITDIVMEKGNQLVVLFEHVPQEMGQIGYTSQTTTQKSRFTYKWDFSTRMVPIGIWDDVFLKITGTALIEEVSIKTDLSEDSLHGSVKVQGIIRLSIPGVALSDIVCRIDLTDKNNNVTMTTASLVDGQEDEVIFNGCLAVDKPHLWFPNGMGDQPLYKVEISVQDKYSLSDTWKGQTGFVRLEWQRNEGADSGTLPYLPVVHGRRMYIKGVNLTPLDMLYGNIQVERYENIVRLMKAGNVNLVRIWGGGLIEKQWLYDLCDRAGIFIWQEFIQSSSGIDNVPSKQPHYLELLALTAVSALKQKRNHVSLACWSGGNELTDSEGVPANYQDENIAMLKELVDIHDPGRHFFPTSASGPNEFLNLKQPGLNHDVHGGWKYLGEEEHYQTYNTCDSLLHSEFGVDGCASIKSIRNFIPEKDLIVTGMHVNSVWRHHGEWWDTLERDSRLFGTFTDLSIFTEASQWTQAEGLRYIIEANRRRKYKNSGSIVWQLNEPFPNVSCTSMVDYYGVPKMAYYFMRNAYDTKLISLRYSKLVYEQDEIFTAECFVHNGEADIKLMDWQADCFDLNGKMIWSKAGSSSVGGDQCVNVNQWSFSTKGISDVFLIRLRLGVRNEECPTTYNVYAFSTNGKQPFERMLNRKAVELEAILEQSDEESEQTNGRKLWRDYRYRISNTGQIPALYIRAESDSGEIFSKDNYLISLLPGESAIMHISWREAKEAVEQPGKIRFLSW